MPGLGSASLEINGYRMPDKYESALQAGVRFFVLRYPRGTDNNESLFGVFDVNAKVLANHQTRGPSWDIKWITGHDASITFVVQPRSKTAIAFMPDDQYYHNRVVLCDQNWLLVEGLYSSSKGMMSSGDALVEIKCLRDVINEEKTIYKLVTPNGREVCYFHSEADAEEQRTMFETKMRNKMPFQEQSYLKCKIVPGKKMAKTNEVQDLIRKYAGIPFGWTACDEFMNDIRLRVNRLIKERTKVAIPEHQISPVNLEQQIQNVIKNMTTEQISALKNAPAPKTEAPAKTPGVDDGDKDNGAGEKPEGENAVSGLPPAKEYKRYELEKKNKPELIDVARQKGVPADDNMTRAKIIDAIIESQEAEPVIV